MEGDLTPQSVSRRLIQLSSARPELHSFNRQFIRLLLDATDALAATLWLAHGNELVRSDEMEQETGAVQAIALPQNDQRAALRGAFEEGKLLVLKNPPPPGAMLGDLSAERRIVFVPIRGGKMNFGVIRLVFDPTPDDLLHRTIQLAEAIAGYYALYAAERVLQIQHRERQEIDRLSKAILQLQHFTFSRQFPEVAVNSALEISPQLDRVTLLTSDKGAELSVAGVSSVAQPDRKSAWAKLVCDLGAIVVQRGEPVAFFPRHTKQEEIADVELRECLNSYAVMTNALSPLIFPLKSGESPAGVLVLESYQEQPLSPFERMLCAVYATHVGSTLANRNTFDRIPFARFFAADLTEGGRPVRRGRRLAGRLTKTGVVLGLLGALVWFVGLHRVPERISVPCFVVPHVTRVVTAKVPGEVEAVLFRQGDRVQKGQPLVRLKTDDLELALAKTLENISSIEINVKKFRGQADSEQDPERRGQLLSQTLVLGHSLAAEQHEIEIIRTKLADCVLHAPIGGVVMGPQEPEKMVGMVVPLGQALCEVGQIAEKVMIRAAVPEADAPAVEVGLEVEISLQPLIEEETLVGRIERLASRSTTYENANVFMAEVIVENRPAVKAPDAEEPDYLLKPGMTGKARIKTQADTTYFSIYYRLLKRKLSYWLF